MFQYTLIKHLQIIMCPFPNLTAPAELSFSQVSIREMKSSGCFSVYPKMEKE